MPPANPECRCFTPVAAMFCPYGHMLECHYPMTCEEAECEHYKRDIEAEMEQGDPTEVDWELGE